MPDSPRRLGKISPSGFCGKKRDVPRCFPPTSGGLSFGVHTPGASAAEIARAGTEGGTHVTSLVCPQLERTPPISMKLHLLFFQSCQFRAKHDESL